MRIIDEINRGDLKVTLFKMNDRLSLKFERDLTEIIYKFRDGSGINEGNYRDYLTDSLLMKVEALLFNATLVKNDGLNTLGPASNELPNIL